MNILFVIYADTTSLFEKIQRSNSNTKKINNNKNKQVYSVGSLLI